jgi:choline monooxygenase
MARAGLQENTAYDVSEAAVTDHAVWWLWPNVCLLRYPGDGNLMVLNIVPTGPETTFETYDFYFTDNQPTDQQWEALRYVDEVLQKEDIDIVESVQRGMRTPAYDRGRYMTDPQGGGLSEHGVHHFHSLVLEAYEADLKAADPQSAAAQ